jgi:rhodanese-related sulfurtransferase
MINKITLLLLLLVTQISSKAQVADQLSPAAFEQQCLLPATQILDVRTAEEYKTGYIAGALQANWLNKEEFKLRTQHLNAKKPVLIYCASGGRSADAAKQLRAAGFIVSELIGGLNKYKREGLALKVDQPVPQFSMADFQALVSSAPVVLVDFGAPWCPPCKKMEPVLMSLQNDLAGKFSLQKIDGGVHINLMKSLQVDALPHFLVYKNGKKTWEKQGIVSLDELKTALQ